MLVDKGSALCDMADYNLFDKLGGNIQKKKLEKALEMLRDEDPRELRKGLATLILRRYWKKSMSLIWISLVRWGLVWMKSEAE